MAKKNVLAPPANPIVILDETGGILADQLPSGKIKSVGTFDQDALVSAVLSQAPLSTDILPMHCRYYSKTTKNGLPAETFFLEFPPAIYSINYKAYDVIKSENDPDGRLFYATKVFNILYPYIYFYVQLDSNKTVLDNKLGSRMSPIKDKSDIIGALATSNIHADGRICWGNNFPDLDKNCSSADYVMKLYNEFWKMYFNDDLPRNYAQMPSFEYPETIYQINDMRLTYDYHRQGKTFANLEYMTQQNKDLIMSCKPSNLCYVRDWIK